MSYLPPRPRPLISFAPPISRSNPDPSFSTSPELLNDDYITSTKLKIKSSTPTGVVYTVAAEKAPSASEIGADVSIQIPLYDNRGKCTTKLFTSGRTTVEAKLDNLGVKGLTATILKGFGGKDLLTASSEFKHGPIGATAAADVNGQTVRSSLAMAWAPAGYAGFFVAGVDGVAAKGDEGVTADAADFAVSYYDGAESEATVHVSDKGTKGMVSYSHQVRSGFSVATQFKYDKTKDDASMVFGGAARLDGVTVVKGKMDSNGVCALSYIQDIRAKTTMIFSTKFDVQKLDDARVGFSLALD